MGVDALQGGVCGVVLIGRYANMAFKRTDFVLDFVLKPDACTNGDMHRNQANGNGDDSDFNNWCRNTIFIGLRTDNAFGDE